MNMTHAQYSAQQAQRQASRDHEALRQRPDFGPFRAELDTQSAEEWAALEAWVLPAPAAQLTAWMDRGDLSAYDLTRLHLRRIEQLDSDLNSVMALNPRALADAQALDAERRAGQVRSALHGLTVLIKDNTAVAGLPWTAGAAALAAHCAAEDAPLVARLRKAGAVILGKTNLSEWSNFMTEDSVNGYSVLGGHTRHPQGPYDVGGSSSGSAVAAAMNFSAMTVGTETSGSLSYPGSQHGLYVLKPTLGLVSRSGILPITEAQDTAGPMARHCADLATLLAGMVGEDPTDPVTAAARGFIVPAPHHLRPDALRGVRVALHWPSDWPDASRVAAEQALRRAGAVTVPAELDVPEMDWLSVMLHGMQTDLPRALKAGGAPLTTLAELVAFNAGRPAERAPYGQRLLERALDPAEQVSPERYAAARTANRDRARAALSGALKHTGARWVASGGADLSDHYCAAGFPALTVPAGRHHSGEPFGLTLIGPALSDGELLHAGFALEASSAEEQPG